MRLLGQIIFVCLVLAALQALLAVAAFAVIGLVIVGLITKPNETWGFLFLCAIMASLQAYPLATLVAGASLGCAVLFARIHKGRQEKRGRVPRPPLLLPAPTTPAE